MNIFNYAMQMEKEGEAFYQTMALKSPNKGMKNIFIFLASQELRHYDFLESMKKNEEIKIQETTFSADIKNIFKEMKRENKNMDVNILPKEMYKKAQDLEKKTEEFYLEQAKLAKQNGQKEIFEKIAAEEKQHYWLLEDLIEFTSRPERWLENAEWNHHDEY